MSKKIIPYFLGIKTGGKLVLNNREQFDRYITIFKEETKLRVSVEEMKRVRTPGQNNFWHGVFCAIVAEDTGDSIDEVCKSIKRMLGRPYYWREKDHFGNTRERFWSTADMKVGELVELQETAKMEFAKREFVYVFPEREQIASF